MRNFILFLTLLMTTNQIWSQNNSFPIEWGELQRSPGSLVEVLPKSKIDFFSVRWSGNGLMGTYRLVSHENLSILLQKRIKTVTETGYSNFETAFYFGEQIIVIMSDRSGNEMSLYSQRYSEELEPISTAEKIATYSNNRLSARPEFKLYQSQNRKFIGVVWEIQGKGNTNDIYGYSIINEKMKTIQSGEYVLPFDGNMSTINDHHISNNGTYILCVTEHNHAVDKMFSRSYDNYKALHLYKINSGQLREFKIQVEGLRIDDLQINSNDSTFCTLTAIYGKGFKNGIEGMVFAKIDTQLDSVVTQGVVKFGGEITMQRWNDNWNDNTWNQNNNFASPAITNNNLNQSNYYTYKLRDLFVLEDGSMVGSMEEYYLYRRVNFDNRTGTSSNILYYYYDDIIAFKIGSNGILEWQKRIEKNQVSMNDGGPYSSYCSFTDGKSLHFIFNDNSRNYSDQGVFVQNDRRVYPFNLSRRKNAAALASIEIGTGLSYRKTLFTRQEVDVLVVPKLFKIDFVLKEILMYSINGTKERFGVLYYGK